MFHFFKTMFNFFTECFIFSEKCFIFRSKCGKISLFWVKNRENRPFLGLFGAFYRHFRPILGQSWPILVKSRGLYKRFLFYTRTQPGFFLLGLREYKIARYVKYLSERSEHILTFLYTHRRSRVFSYWGLGKYINLGKIR